MRPRPYGPPIEILLVEDSPDDAELMVEALQQGNLNPRVTVVEDGEEAMHYLRGRGTHGAAPRPDLILLDLHLPRKNGHEVLVELENDPELGRIPVVVLTSFDTRNGPRGHPGGHLCCVRKPVEIEHFAEAVEEIECFWGQVLPCADGR